MVVDYRSTLLPTRRSSRPSATSPDAEWMRHLAREPPSKTITLMQPHQLRHSGRRRRNNKKLCLDEGAIAEEGNVAEEDQDSETSDDEDGN